VRVVQIFVVVAARGVVREHVDRGRPVQRPLGPLRRAFAQRLHEVVRIRGRRLQAGVLEIIHAHRESAPDLLGAVRMRYHRQLARVGLVHDGADLLGGHLILIDQLDHVHAGVGQSLHLRARVGHAVDPPPELLGAGIGRVLQERSRGVDRGPLQLSACDAPLHVEHLVQRCPQITHAGHAGHEALPRRCRHDAASPFARIYAVPVRVVAVPHQHQVHMHVP